MLDVRKNYKYLAQRLAVRASSSIEDRNRTKKLLQSSQIANPSSDVVPHSTQQMAPSKRYVFFGPTQRFIYVLGRR